MRISDKHMIPYVPKKSRQKAEAKMLKSKMIVSWRNAAIRRAYGHILSKVAMKRRGCPLPCEAGIIYTGSSEIAVVI